MSEKTKVGFIGQGWIGKNYADDFERRGYEVVRYALEEPYAQNKDKVAECDVVFIAVPTPTTPEGFDDSILRKAIKAVGKGNVAIIKSTIIPGTTESIQAENPDIFVFHSPEFLAEATAARDAAFPNRNIIGIPKDDKANREKAELVMSVLPHSPYELITSAKSAELIKYGGNIFLYIKVVYANLFYDLAAAIGADPNEVLEAVSHDPRIGPSHMKPVHSSGHARDKKPGRGAGGHCFIKDFAALKNMYASEIADDAEGLALLEALEKRNNKYLRDSGKDLDLLEGVCG